MRKMVKTFDSKLLPQNKHSCRRLLIIVFTPDKQKNSIVFTPDKQKNCISLGSLHHGMMLSATRVMFELMQTMLT